MWKVSSATLDGAAGSLHVDPEEVAHERLLEVVVDVRMIDDPQQLVHGHDRLTHGLYEPVLTLQYHHHHHHQQQQQQQQNTQRTMFMFLY